MKNEVLEVMLGKPIFHEVLKNALLRQNYAKLFLQHQCITYIDRKEMMTYTWTFTTKKTNMLGNRIFHNKLIGTTLISGIPGEQYLGIPGFKFLANDIISYKTSEELKEYYEEYKLEIHAAIARGAITAGDGHEGVIDLRKRLGIGKEYE